mmetsp:Transcript_15470/g.48632  ORF Transcript_15470/g.48632 Transcript_15470/m.48632 type:complete len:196 (+) Transcript_15470:73-660(+)
MARSAAPLRLRGQRRPRALCLIALGLVGFHAASRCFLPVSPRTSSSMVARAAFESGKVNVGVDASSGRAVSVPVPLLEANEATNVAIMDCLEEGCSVDALMALDAKLARDEQKVKESIEEVEARQKTEFSEDNTEALAWFKNFLGRTGTLRGQLQAMRGIENVDFAKQFIKAASVAFGGGRPTDYPKIGVSSYSA